MARHQPPKNNTKYGAFIVAAIFLACMNNSIAVAQNAADALRASIAVSSDFVQNGLLQTNDGPTFRLAFDYEHKSGFFAGGMLANIDYVAESDFRTPRDTQATVYAGYVWHRDQWRTNVTVSQYEYPGIERNYDYTQASVTVSFRDRYFLSLVKSGDYLEFYDRSDQIYAGFALPWIQNLEFSASAGRLSFGGQFASSFSYWDIGLSRPFGRLALDLRFHDNSFNRNSIAGNLTHNQWVLSMTYALLPFQRSRDRR